MEWIKGHQDKGHQWEDIRDLAHLKLNPAAYLSIWCDANAAKHRERNVSAPDAEVLPIEKWAVYSCYPITRKITGKLEHGIHESMYSNSLCEFIRKKHSLCSAKIENVNTDGLKSYLGRLNVFKRASVAKLIHRWIPTNDHMHKQGQAGSPSCPRGCAQPETADHILTCGTNDAIKHRQTALYETLTNLVKINTSIHILSTLEEILAETLNITSLQKYKSTQPLDTHCQRSLNTARQNQNIIGWNNFLRGYISKYWANTQELSWHGSPPTAKQSMSATNFTAAAIDLHRRIWEDRNTFVYGKTIQEAREKLREKVIQQVTQIYQKPPNLAPRYHSITTVPLQARLNKTTKELTDWLARIQHQQKVTELIRSTLPFGQLTLKQAFANHTCLKREGHQYPP